MSTRTGGANGRNDPDAPADPEAPNDPNADDPDHYEVDTRVPVPALVASLAGMTVAFLATALAAPVAAPVAGLAVVTVAVGLLRTSTRVLTWGAAFGAAGIALAGYEGGAPAALLVAAVGLVVAWDVGDHGLSLGAHVGRAAVSRRNVAVHAAGSLLVGVLTATVVYGTYLAAAGGQPVAALALLLFGAVVLLSTFR
ncbi:hypothetical protein JCM17823_13700 [Halorubrum gandharaense]